jgi:hypothetical protein
MATLRGKKPTGKLSNQVGFFLSSKSVSKSLAPHQAQLTLP